MDYQDLFEPVTRAVEPTLDAGHVADHIPALATADPTRFGFAVADLTTHVHGTGDWQLPFSIQTLSKLFTPQQIAQQSHAPPQSPGEHPTTPPAGTTPPQ